MTKNIEEIVSSIVKKLPPGLKEFKQDIENHTKAVLTDLATKSDLVTREEFETQKKVLQKTRKMVEDLEKKIQKLEPKD
jgi:BMFP domain-containing protein YqiC